MKSAWLPIAALLCAGLTGCASMPLGKKKAISVPPAPAPAGVPAPLPSAAPSVPVGGQPVPVVAAEPEPPPPEPLPPLTRTVPVPKPAVQQAGRRPATPAPAPAPTAESTPLRLGAILSPERQRQYQADLKRSLTAARAATSQAGTAALTPTQKETMVRVETFIQQAEATAGQDLATAVQLARRAELLGQELSRSLR